MKKLPRRAICRAFGHRPVKKTVSEEGKDTIYQVCERCGAELMRIGVFDTVKGVWIEGGLW